MGMEISDEDFSLDALVESPERREMLADFARKCLGEDIAPKLTEDEKMFLRVMLEEVTDA